jgi:putative transposase
MFRLDIEPTYIQDHGICSKKLGAMKATYDGQPFSWSSIQKECQLQYNVKDDRFFLLVPFDQEAKPPSHERKEWIALDPGVRTFMTGLSQSETLKFGDGIYKKLLKYLQRADLSRSKKKGQRLRDKVKNLVDDLHWKTANYLVKNYETIFIGDMSAKKVIRGKGTGLSSSTKRSLMALSLFKFHQRLAFKAQQYHAQCMVVNEAYTTKVCSCCGIVNENVGCQRVFRCASCSHSCDRDVDGARCIAIKALM